MKKTRNYTIDLFRFIFALGFVFGHLAIILGRLPGRESSKSFTFALDTLSVFICIAGYFMMSHFKKQQAKAEKDKISPVNQAWNYLKSRIRTLGVWFLIGNIGGFIGLCLFTHTPLNQWFDAFLNHLGEFCGLMLTGFGYGTALHGAYNSASSEYILINGPLWFVSGLFICSYFLYYLLAKDEKKTVGIIIPLISLFFYGSTYLNGVQPFWRNFAHIGDFNINLAMIDMFCNLGIGCLMYEGVQALKDKEFSKPFTIFLTVIQTFLLIFIPFRTLCPTNVSWNPFTFNWGPAYLLSLLFTFLLLLNKDKATQFLNRKVFGYLGGISMHIYCLHYAVIILVYVLFKDFVEKNVGIYILVVIIITMLISIIAKLVSKPIDNWLLSEPWFKKETKNKRKKSA